MAVRRQQLPCPREQAPLADEPFNLGQLWRRYHIQSEVLAVCSPIAACWSAEQIVGSSCPIMMTEEPVDVAETVIAADSDSLTNRRISNPGITNAKSRTTPTNCAHPGVYLRLICKPVAVTCAVPPALEMDC
jgi:hypothetical protein